MTCKELNVLNSWTKFCNCNKHEWIIYRYELIFNMCGTNLKTVHTFRSFLYGAILDRPKNTALGGGGGKNTKQQAPQGKLIIQWLNSACLSL